MKNLLTSALWAIAGVCLLVSAVYADGEFIDPSIDRDDSGDFDSSEAQLRAAAKGNLSYNPDHSKTAPMPREYGPVSGSMADEPTGSLSGRIVYLMGGHGYEYSSGAYRTQRGVNNGMVEDFGNLDQATIMADYLINAGATVAPMRPLGNQNIERVVDNDDAGVTFSGTWFNSTSTAFYGDTGDVPYRYASTVIGSTTATARYNASIPTTDFYPVYVHARFGPDRINQQYLVGHSGGVASRRINHRMVGNGWIYLGTYHFVAGGQAYVEITNNAQSGETGSVVIADAVRFGNGMGDVILDGAPSVSGKPRQEEHGEYWAVESAGNQGSTFVGLGSVAAPRELAQYMNRIEEGTQLKRVYLSFHSNAGGGRGADGLFNSNAATPSVPNGNNWNNGDPATGDDLAQALGNAVNTAMTALTGGANNPLEEAWGNPGGGNETYASGQNGFSAYGELNYSSNPEMPQTIIEVAFHDSAEDARIMLDQKGRDAIARATLDGLLTFFNDKDGGSTTLLPSPPLDPSITQSAGTVTLRWTPPVAGGVYGVGGDAPTSHRVYISTNGYGFDLAQSVAGGTTNSLDVTALCPLGEPRFFRVAAVNAGGESFPTGTVAVIRSATGNKVLVVNAFDRLQRSQNYIQTEPIPGTFGRVLSRYNNSFDYPVEYALALDAANIAGLDTCQNDHIISGAVSLNNYEAAFWINGTESTNHETFSSIEQTHVENFIANGGGFFGSGSEIAWDIGWLGSSGDRTFLNSTLRVATPINGTTDDDAGTYNAIGVSGTLFDGQSLTFSNGATERTYDVAYPDIVRPSGGSQTVLTYSGGAGAGQSAAIAHDGSGVGRGNVVLFGFPWETITDSAKRAAIMDDVAPFLGATTSVGEWWMLH